jgi:hypothetical protein
MRRCSSRLPVAVALAGLAGCQSYYPVPLRDGVFPPTAVRAGERVRVETRGGESSAFEVASADDRALVGAAGQRVAQGDLQALQVERLNKRKTFITLGVIGGIIGTALILDEAEEISDCLEFEDFDDCVE